MDLLKDPLNKLIISLSLPAGVGMMFNTLYNVTGTFFAAKISTLAVAGMAMSFLLYLSVVGIGLGFGSALTALIGNSLGANKSKMAKLYASNGIIFVLLFALFMGLCGYLLAPNLLVILGADHHYIKEALDYAGVIFLAAIATALLPASPAINPAANFSGLKLPSSSIEFSVPPTKPLAM